MPQLCPQCCSIGLKNELQTYQINLEEAIVLCTNKQCTYPFEKKNEPSTPTTFQRDFSKIARNPSQPSPSQQALQTRVAQHMRKNGHSLQKGDIGIQTESSKSRRKCKSSQSWRKQPSLTSSSSSNAVSGCFQQFHSLSNDISGPENNRLETKTWNSCYGSDGASDRDSLNSSQDGAESANQGSFNLPSESCSGASSLYEGFQFGQRSSNASSVTCRSAYSADNVNDMEQFLENLEKSCQLETQLDPKMCSNSTAVINAKTKTDLIVDDQSENVKAMSDTKSLEDRKSADKKLMTENMKSIVKTENVDSITKDHNNDNLMYPLKFPQWKNQDALCWLDVILCLTVHNVSLKSLVLGETFDHTNIIHRLVIAHQQACEIISSDKNRNSMLENCELRDTASSNSSVSIKENVNLTKKASFEGLVLASKMNNTSKRVLSSELDNTSKSLKASQFSGVSEQGRESGDCTTKAENKLNEIREEVWEILRKKLKCNKGQPESVMFALPLLLRESRMVENLFKMKYRFEYICSQCGYEESTTCSSCLPTLPAVPDDFSITSPQHNRTCSHCKNNKDRRKLIYEQIPQCMLMHFTDGLPHLDVTQLQLTHNSTEYTVTGLVQYKRSPDHFVAWLHNPIDNKWMKCDDLKPMVCEYRSNPPRFPPQQVHIVMWEKVVPGHPATSKSEIVVTESATSKLSNGDDLSKSDMAIDSDLSSKVVTSGASLKSEIITNGAVSKLTPIPTPIHSSQVMAPNMSNCKTKDITTVSNVKPMKLFEPMKLSSSKGQSAKGQLDLTKVTKGDRNLRELNVASSDNSSNRCSTLSTESPDSIYLPNFVSSTPVQSKLVKPEPRQLNYLSSVKSNKQICNNENIDQLNIEMPTFVPSCDIQGQRKSIQPSSVFHVPAKTMASTVIVRSYVESIKPSLVSEPVLPIGKSDNNVSDRKACETNEKGDSIDSKCSKQSSDEHNELLNVSNLMNSSQSKVCLTTEKEKLPSVTENHRRKSTETTNLSKVVEFCEKVNTSSYISGNPLTESGKREKVLKTTPKDDTQGCEPISVANSSTSIKNLSVLQTVSSSSSVTMVTTPKPVNNNSGVTVVKGPCSTGSTPFFRKKSKFMLPIPSVKRVSVSKDAFFTLDIGNQKSSTPKANLSTDSVKVTPTLTSNSTSLNGDVSVLNSVKQYLLSKTTDKVIPKMKFKGMDLKSSPATSCSDLVLPRSSTQSVDTLCSAENLRGSTTSLSSSASSHSQKSSLKNSVKQKSSSSVNEDGQSLKSGSSSSSKRKSDCGVTRNKPVKRTCLDNKMTKNDQVVTSDNNSMMKVPVSDIMNHSSTVAMVADKMSEKINNSVMENSIQNLYNALNIEFNSDSFTDIANVNDILEGLI